MKVKKDVYPKLGEKSSLMALAEKSLLDDMQTYLIQPNEWQFILQCAWIIGFKEGKKGAKKQRADAIEEAENCETIESRTDTEDIGDMFPVFNPETILHDEKIGK